VSDEWSYKLVGSLAARRGTDSAMNTPDMVRRTGTRVQQAAGQASRSGRSAERSRWFGLLIMIGLVAYGVVHLLVAWIALQVAWTNSDQDASQQGALQQMAGGGIGDVLLWITAVGLFALTLWMIASAIWGYQDDEGGTRVGKRLAAAGKAVVYAALGVSAVSTAAGSGGGSGDSGEKTLSSRLLALPFGPALVIAVGVVVVVVAGRLADRGLRKKFLDDLEGTPGRAVTVLGQTGYCAKGVAFAVVGVLFVVAGATYDADKAGGLDSALKTLRQQVFGSVLLTVVALGIACFGLFCFAWSRRAKR
jgi:type IV secretory pathway VirB2 component (pilin)